MCGICGELRFDATPVQAQTLDKMLKVLAPRGPDDAGQWIKNNVGFGHQRLAIIDLSEHGHQPMYDAELGLTLVFNGTIYNYPQLRKELIQKGYQFFSHSDTEVILKAYHAWGEQCLSRLQGMFAFAIWDGRRLFVARDRFGIKPLYYAQTAKGFRFASTLPALLAAGDVDKSIDPVGLHHQFTLHAVIPAPYTILKGIRKVPPAHFITITPEGKVETQRYWQLQAQRPQQALTDSQWIEATHEALKAAVDSHRTIADVPVGVLLSGGLDSSLLVGLLAENTDVENLLTFSIGFDDVADEKGSEFEYSDQVVDRYHTRHHKLQIPNNQVLTRLPEAITHMSEPMVGQDAVAFYLLAEQVSKQVKVVQSGQGADEVFAGYFWYPMMNAATGSDLDRFAPYYFDRSHDEFLQTVTSDYHGEDYTSLLVSELLAADGADDFLDKVLRMDVTTLIVDDPVKRVDNMTMAWGLEARVPFLDHQLVELAAQIPPELKLRESGKHPLKAIARDLLPASVIDRPKGYFPMPALKYVRGEFLQFMQETLDSTACHQRGLFQRDYVNKLLAQPEQYMTKLNGSKLWHLTLLEAWLQEHVD
ncbi:N-acetylglutaminylglutamine amidotransferase [Candidatus Albibeggiatoa sp. nov. NOAA]|uniref:N-acetylglutaminylglutamine amidotransferase n=1 Tax=Candidatus Albibeggiatoa sp. nov. NOAA TaxID=3162724 RepID=UPI0032FBD016|nr:N-acetylglutaminylglutamine amidotransferase [Thiotrichaceae bacterium]